MRVAVCGLGPGAQRAGLQGAARLVVGAARIARRDRPAGAGHRRGPEVGADAVQHPLGQLEELVVVGRGGTSAHASRPAEATRPGTASLAQRGAQRALAGLQRRPLGRARTPAPPRARPRPKGSRRRARSAPATVPPTSSVSTSPASRRSVEAATWRRSSSSATTVTAWCRTSAVELRQRARVLDDDEPGLRQPRVGRPGRAAPARRPGSASCGRDEAARLGAARALAHLGGQRPQRLGRRLAAGRVAGLRPRRGRRARSRWPPISVASAAVMASSPRSESTMRCRRSWTAIERCSSAYCSLTSRPNAFSVTAMNGVVVRDLEEREVALGARPRTSAGGHLVVREADAEAEAGQAVVGQQRQTYARCGRACRATCPW